MLIKNALTTIKQTVLYGSLVLAAALTLTLAAPTPTHAQNAKGQVCDAVGGCAGGGADVSNVFITIIEILSVVGGVIAVIMIIIGGIKYVLASGDPNNVSSAKNTVLYAIIGLVIVALAQVIVRFVLEKI